MAVSQATLLSPKLGGKAPLWSCVISLINTMLGTGLLGMPWAISRCNLSYGLVLLAVGAIIAGSTLHMLARVTIRFPGASFKQLMTKSMLPKPLQSLPDLAIVFMCIMGGQASYLIAIGDAAQTAARYWWPSAAPLFHCHRFWVCVAMVLLTPLCLQRQLNSLRHTSALSLGASLIVVMVVVFRAVAMVNSGTVPLAPDGPRKNLATMDALLSALNSVSVFVFGYTCHQQLPTLALELRQRTAARLALASTIAVIVAACIYGVVGIAGSFAFGADVKGNVLLELQGSRAGAWASCALAFALTTTIPMWTHAGREAAMHLLRPFDAPPITSFGLCAFTGLILVPSFILALLLDDLGVAFSLVGGTGCAIVSLILPGLFYLRLGPSYAAKHWTPSGCLACVVVALGFSLVGKTLLGVLI